MYAFKFRQTVRLSKRLNGALPHSSSISAHTTQTWLSFSSSGVKLNWRLSSKVSPLTQEKSFSFGSSARIGKEQRQQSVLGTVEQPLARACVDSHRCLQRVIADPAHYIKRFKNSLKSIHRKSSASSKKTEMHSICITNYPSRASERKGEKIEKHRVETAAMQV